MNDLSAALFQSLSPTCSSCIQGGWWGYHAIPSSATSLGSTIHDDSSQPVTPASFSPFPDDLQPRAEGGPSDGSSLFHAYTYGYYGQRSAAHGHL